MPRKSDVSIEGLLSRCIRNEETGCMEWQGAIASGYGRVSVKGKKLLAHRLMYTLKHPELSVEGIEICHQCDNPKCINPDHLFHGTKSENMLDASRKGRLFVRRDCDPKHDPALVEPIKEMLRSGMSKRAIARKLGWAWSSYREFELRHSILA